MCEMHQNFDQCSEQIKPMNVARVLGSVDEIDANQYCMQIR
jgi:hypothetical protein